ncbi:MAG: DUF2784 domain-containing protein [Gammaproteobacteria bacterium]|nr:DUF2784 domain-containing protein [Gammaproteobacteria bacterium]MBQ0841076.1 DUF2784 domain-containing protein [Gammaproteobacteria bacterium]
MPYSAAADAVLLTHLLLIIYGLLGGLLYFWRAWLALVHFPLAVWISLIEFFNWTCPLTPLEKQLRILAGDGAYSGGFIEHYLIALIYPGGMTRTLALALGVIALGSNLLIYGFILRDGYLRWRRG